MYFMEFNSIEKNENFRKLCTNVSDTCNRASLLFSRRPEIKEKFVTIPFLCQYYPAYL